VRLIVIISTLNVTANIYFRLHLLCHISPLTSRHSPGQALKGNKNLSQFSPFVEGMASPREMKFLNIAADGVSTARHQPKTKVCEDTNLGNESL